MVRRVAGWSGATQRASVISHASLDLANVSDYFDPPLLSVLCTPLVHENELLGVLTAYSNKQDAFREAHGYASEQIGSALLDRLRTVSDIDTNRNLVFRARNR